MTTIIAGLIYACYAAAVLSLGWNLLRTIKLLGQNRTIHAAEQAPATQPPLDVLIPVKDEQANIATCIESVLAQDHTNTRIIVVNDRSTDDTAAAVQAVQDRHPQVRRTDIEELPSGLYGKPHALHSVRAELGGDFIAFVDSDLKLEPPCLTALVSHLTTNQLDWLAVAGRPELTGFWERVLIPMLGAVKFAWYDPRKISDPNWPDAVGSALMICRRDSYEAIGGHGAVIDIYDEDSELMRIAKRAGQRIEYVITPQLFSQRHYGTFARTVRGLTRTLAGGLKTLRRLAMTVNAVNFISLLPFGVLFLPAVAAGLGRPILWAPLWLATAAIHLVISNTLAWLVYRTAGVGWPYALCHPLGALVMIAVSLRAARMVTSGKTLAWRGTTYTADADAPVLRRGSRTP